MAHFAVQMCKKTQNKTKKNYKREINSIECYIRTCWLRGHGKHMHLSTHTTTHTQQTRHLILFPGSTAVLTLPSPLSPLLCCPCSTPLLSSPSCGCECVLWVNDVLFGGFCQVSGSGPAASGPLLYPG